MEKREINPNHLETFPCAKKDKEARRSNSLCFIVFYFVFIAVNISGDLVIDQKIKPSARWFTSPIIYAAVLTIISVKKVRGYTVDYQNNVIADMGDEQEIIPFLEIIGVEMVDRERSFELVKAFKIIRFTGTYQARDNKPVKVYASSRSHFVLIKTKTIPNYILSPAEPEKFIRFLQNRLNQ